MTSVSLAKRVRAGSLNWPLFLLLLGLGIFGLISIIPYSLTLVGQQLDRAQLGMMAIQFVPQVAALAVQIALGLFLAGRVALGVPLLAAWLGGERAWAGLRSLLLPALLGLIAGVLTLGLDQGFFAPRVTAEYQAAGIALPQNPNPPAWQGFLASFYGGINEEILMRLFLLTLLAWIGTKLSRAADGRPTPAVLWASTILAGLALGLAHLPAAVAMGVPLTGLSVGRTLVLNASGILFGWLYWRRGLVSAMVAHFSLDIVLHVVGALVLSL
jgi:hypothetical protein